MIMGNLTHILPVLQLLEVVIAFVSSVSSLFVSLSVNKITQKVVTNFHEMLTVDDYSPGMNRLDFGTDPDPGLNTVLGNAN